MREKANDPKWLGQKYGRLTVNGFVHVGKKWLWECKCECGASVVVRPYLVRSGHTGSCGCLQRERVSEVSTTHGESRSRLYRIYNGMKNRCYNPAQANYSSYGGRGIKICDEWLNSFAVFQEWALSNGYTDQLSIDRIDNDGDYEPSNCRWVPRSVQQRNTSRTNLITINERTQSLTDWAAECGLNFHTVSFRIHQKKMTPEQALGLEDSDHDR